MKIEIEGVDEIIKGLKKRLDEAPGIVADWLDGHGDDALERVKLRTPVDSGDLRRNWEKQPIQRVGDEYSQEITNNVEYLPHVEYGHRTREGSGVIPGVFMAKTSREITKDAMKADMPNLAKRISGAK